ncbi:MAG: hypothetical protein DBX39_03095, partial [Bacillota bacterium]
MLAGSVFSNCPKLSEVICDGTLRSSSSNFSNTALYNNEDNWENGALYIGNYLADFDESKITTQSFKVKEGTVSVSGSAFIYNSESAVQVTSVDFGNTVKYIGSWAFDGANIGDSAFRNCNSVGYMIIPASVKTICRSGLQISQNGKLFLRGAFKGIYAENEWNGYAFATLKPVPYYEYSETQKSGYWHFN